MRRLAIILGTVLALGAAGCRVSRQKSVNDYGTALRVAAVTSRLDSAGAARSLRLDSVRLTVEYADSPRRRIVCEAARLVAADSVVTVARESSSGVSEVTAEERESKSRSSRPGWTGAAVTVASFAAGILSGWLILRSRRKRGLP